MLRISLLIKNIKPFSNNNIIFNKAVLEPRVSPAFPCTYFCNHCNIRFENTSKYVDTLILFSKKLNQRSLTPTWPLTPCLLRSHVWLYPRIIVSKSRDNTSMYVDTVINLANYHIHTTYIHTTYYVQNEWSHSLLLNSVQARQKVSICCPKQKNALQLQKIMILINNLFSLLSRLSFWFVCERPHGEEVNLFCLQRKTRFTRLSPLVDSRAFDAQYSRFALDTRARGVFLTDHAKPSLWQRLWFVTRNTSLNSLLLAIINSKQQRIVSLA